MSKKTVFYVAGFAALAGVAWWLFRPDTAQEKRHVENQNTAGRADSRAAVVQQAIEQGVVDAEGAFIRPPDPIVTANLRRAMTDRSFVVDRSSLTGNRPAPP